MSRAPMPDSASGGVPMPSSFDEDLEFWEEGRWRKLVRKLKEEPLIPLGLGLTCYALYNATRSIRKGDKEQTNRWFRARVYAQGFTLLCVCLGAVYYKEEREKRKQYQGLLGEKRAKEKRERWLKELEARDRDDTIQREIRLRRRERAKQGLPPEETEDEAQSPGEVGDVRKLFISSSIIGPAMRIWRSHSE